MNDPYPFVESKCGVKGLFYYGSSYSCSAYNLGSRMRVQINRVYQFKKWHRNAELIGELIRQSAEQLGCSEIWAIPSSTVGRVNILQVLFGVKIERTKNAELRKYNHHVPVDTSGLKYPESASGEVLLVDDVCTTGMTQISIAKELAARGIVCKMLAVGMNRKIVHPNSPSPEVVEDAFRRWKEQQHEEEAVETSEGTAQEEPALGNLDVAALLNSVSGGAVEVEDEDDFEDKIVVMAEDESISPEQRLKNIVELVRARQ